MLWVLHNRAGADRSQKGAANTLEPELQEVVRGCCRSPGKISVPSKSNTNSAEPAVQYLKLCLYHSSWLGLRGFFFSHLTVLKCILFCPLVPSVCVFSFHLSQMNCSTKKDVAKECTIFLFLGYGLDGHNQCVWSGRSHLLHWKHTVERAWTLELNIAVLAPTQSTNYLAH